MHSDPLASGAILHATRTHSISFNQLTTCEARLVTPIGQMEKGRFPQAKGLQGYRESELTWWDLLAGPACFSPGEGRGVGVRKKDFGRGQVESCELL